MNNKIVAYLFVSLVFGAVPVLPQDRGISRPIQEIVKTAIEAPKIHRPQLSPDDSHMVYVMQRESLDKNNVLSALYVQEIGKDASGIKEPVKIAEATLPKDSYAFNEQWCPDGSCISYFPQGPESRLMLYDLGSGKSMAVPVNDVNASSSRPKITNVSGSYEWSPKGKLLAFWATIKKGGRYNPTVGVRVEGDLLQNPGLNFETPGKSGIFVLDTETGQVEQVSPESTSLSYFDWSPDGRSFTVVTATGNDPIAQDRSNIAILDRSTRAIRPLVSKPGPDTMPNWSPDGKWIAFQHGQGLEVVASSGGEPIKLSAPEDRSPLPQSGDIAWAPDSSAFYFSSLEAMALRNYKADFASGKIVPLAFDATSAAGVESFSFNSDRRSQIVVMSGPNRPPDLFLRGVSDGALKQITHLSDNFSLTKTVNAERVQWPSRDGKFTIHGLLLTPSGPRSGPLPTLVFVQGGPSMIHAVYAPGNFEMLSLAARGYAVIIPSTRGRKGYGQRFNRAFESGASFAHLPLEDALAGVDYLIGRGVAGANRLGIMGHSYGGYLALLAATQTNRFRAAINFDGARAVFVNNTMQNLPGTVYSRTFVERFGIKNPFEPLDMARLMAESPAMSAHCATTPLLQVMAEGGPWKMETGVVMYSAYRRLGLPTELILYDDGHIFTRPTNQVDYVTRMSNWFDYWVRDMPYPEPELQKEYDAWKKANFSKPRPSETPCGAKTREIIARKPASASDTNAVSLPR